MADSYVRLRKILVVQQSLPGFEGCETISHVWNRLPGKNKVEKKRSKAYLQQRGREYRKLFELRHPGRVKEATKRSNEKYGRTSSGGPQSRIKRSMHDDLIVRAQYQQQLQRSKADPVVRAKKCTRHKDRVKLNPVFRLTCNLRRRLNLALHGECKSASTRELVGCDTNTLRQHLEKQFRTGMTWGNYGMGGWVMDHIMPCASFDMADPQQQRQCFHYTNLQPLWFSENSSKKDKIIGKARQINALNDGNAAASAHF